MGQRKQNVHYLIFLLAIVASLMVASCKPSLNAFSERVRSLSIRNSEIATEDVIEGDWIFWCRSGWPSGNSGSNHFEAATDFAEKHSLKYLGPKRETSETMSWPLAVVFPDGTTKELLLEGFSFEPDFESFCTFRGATIFEVVGDKVLIRRK